MKKNCDIFLNFAQNIDYGYTIIFVLEQKNENNINPCKPQFYYINVGCKGVYIIRTYSIMTVIGKKVTIFRKTIQGF